MAFERLPFRAQERDAVIVGALNYAVQAVPKGLRSRDTVIADAPVLVAGRVVGAATQGLTQMDVLDPLYLQTAGQGFAVKLGMEAAVGRRADIGQGRDAVPLQERDEGVQGVVGMADGENGMAGCVHGVLPIPPE